MPYADLLKRHHSTKDIPGFDQVFINVAGIVRNLSSHSDAARRRMRETDGLLDALCDIIKLTTQNADDNDINERGIEVRALLWKADKRQGFVKFWLWFFQRKSFNF